MKRFLPVIGAAIIIGIAIVFQKPMGPAVNPDPNHTHADFAVWVNGEKLDFSDPQYMSEVYKEGQETRTNPMRKFLHLHDGVGHVVHRHKPGLTVGEFFASISIPMTSTCLIMDDHQYAQLDGGWKDDFAITKELCDNGKFHWTMMVNGTVRTMDPAFVFADNDQILLSYSSSDTAAQEQWNDMSDDACLYSRTCPQRGDPPTENCIADPEVPCVLPEE